MLLVTLYIIKSTYSVIINVIGREGENDIIESLTIRDILTDNNGNYNELVKNNRKNRFC